MSNGRNNRNALRHGLRCGKLPKGAEYIELQRNAVRVALEDAVRACKGERISIDDAGYIFAACDGYRQSKQSAHWLRKGGDKLKTADRERHSDGVAKGVDRFIKYLSKLNLDRDSNETIIQTLYTRIPAPDDNGSNLEDK